MGGKLQEKLQKAPQQPRLSPPPVDAVKIERGGWNDVEAKKLLGDRRTRFARVLTAPNSDTFPAEIYSWSRSAPSRRRRASGLAATNVPKVPQDSWPGKRPPPRARGGRYTKSLCTLGLRKTHSCTSSTDAALFPMFPARARALGLH